MTGTYLGNMADDVNVQQTAKKLSHKLFKRLLQKEKRRLKRQIAAEAKKQEEIEEKRRLDNDPEYRRKIEAAEMEKERQEMLQRQINEKLWLEREAKAQEEFIRRKQEEERKIMQKAEQERAIKLEWERQQQKEKEDKEKKEQAIKEKEEALFREIGKDATTSEESFHNPVAPLNYGTEKDVVNCSFFLKTGACRFGERCSRHHPRPSSSTTLLVAGMYADIRHIESALDIADRDTGLEFDEQDAYQRFMEFYDDVHPEFERSGRIVQFRVCCNYEQHLRGNVYVQYSSEEECQRAFADFNGRWYAGRQLSCEFSPVTNWKSAICGLFEQNRCPRGKNCNFLHVYRNPDDWSEQRAENRRYRRYKAHDRDDESRFHSVRSRSPSDSSRSGHRSYRSNGRDAYDMRRTHEDRRYKHRRRSRSHSNERRRKKRRRHHSRSSESSSESEEKYNSRLGINGHSPTQDDPDDADRRKHYRSRDKSTSSDSDRSSRSRHKSKKKHKKHKRGRRDKDEISSEDEKT